MNVWENYFNSAKNHLPVDENLTAGSRVKKAIFY